MKSAAHLHWDWVLRQIWRDQNLCHLDVFGHCLTVSGGAS